MSEDSKNIVSSNPDWNIFQKKTGQAVIFSNFAYRQKDEEMHAMADQMPEGYELFLMTDHVTEVGEASFRCAAFVNQDTKEIVFATAGTRPGVDGRGVADIYDDALLVAHNKPRKMNPAQTLNDMILDSLGEHAKDYKFNYTGHSLGAAMAEMQAADMDIKLTQKGLKSELKGKQPQISAVTFENPGTKPMIEKMYAEAGLSKENISKLNFYEFNNRPNIINSLNEQTGTTYTIVPHSQKERNPTLTQMVFEFTAKIIGSEISPLLGKAFGLLAPGGITDDLIAEHTLGNFNEVFVEKQGVLKGQDNNIISLEEAYLGIKPIKYDKAFSEELLRLKKQNGDIGRQTLSMTAVNDLTSQIVRFVFSNEELKKALAQIAVIVKKEISSGIVMGGRKEYNNKVKEQDKLSDVKLELPTVQDIANKTSVSK